MTPPSSTCPAEINGIRGVRLHCSRPFGHVGWHATAGGARWETPHVGRYVWACDPGCPCKSQSVPSTFTLVVDPYNSIGAPNA